MTVSPVARDDASAAFFDGTRAGRFLLLRDRSTGEYLDPRTPRSDDDDLAPVPASGSGRVVSWSGVHSTPSEDGDPVRTVVAIVGLDEGPWWWCRLVGVNPDADLFDLRVEVDFVPSGPDPEHETVPVFRPATEKSGGR
jgi:uncharacterized OB-fold protein